ncbi:HlyD family secretion protein [Flavobacterium sp. LC2016-01]|uniref:HlyD family secretion protein n=1 Tax=Flavobacterium sp. LC2016-01 TaxID=2675876 RepID=UPI0012BACF1A|nr:HlyD family secretion protein [Flavobacterium sp. LC2016-01]MTH14755.1 HlyD family efflux transporter periplasmic adaptor subunit [Flavobacterium sp. LC2016-01]
MKTSINKRTSILSITAIVIGIALISCFVLYLADGANYEETNDAQVESYINPVSARASGYITKVLFEEHQNVKKGDTLVILDNREYTYKVQEAEAVLEDAYAQINVLEAGINVAQTGISVSKNQIASAKARLWQQKQDNLRYQKLLTEEAVTGQEYEQVKTRYDVAQNDYNATENTLLSTQSRVQELKTRRALLNADIKRKEAILDLAKINLSYTVITSPYNGKTGRKQILEGQQVQLGQPLVSIVNENEKWITANFKETQVNGFYIGQPVKITVDAISGKTFNGKIEAISASTGSKFSLLPADNSTGNFIKIIQRIPVKIVFENNKEIEEIKSGMNVTVTVFHKKS